jgi:hypothetical protein
VPGSATASITRSFEKRWQSSRASSLTNPHRQPKPTKKYIDDLQEASPGVRPMIRTLEQLAAWLLFSVSVIFVYGTLVML